MTCKDCIHYEACTMFEDYEDDYAAKNACNIFKDKSKFIELPCNIGDTVYNIKWWDDKIITKKINNETWYRNIRIPKVAKSKFSLFDFNDFGKTVFFTKKEAEARLKELSK